MYQFGKYRGAGIIFENGGYDGFSEGEQMLFLEEVEDTPFRYKFTHVIQVGRDFEAGVFDIIKRKEEKKKEKKHNYSK